MRYPQNTPVSLLLTVCICVVAISDPRISDQLTDEKVGSEVVDRASRNGLPELAKSRTWGTSTPTPGAPPILV